MTSKHDNIGNIYFDYWDGVGIKTECYTGVPSDYLDRYYNYLNIRSLNKRFGHKVDGKFRMQYARSHPVIFSHFMLGVTLRPYQAYIMDLMISHPETALCLARRMGKSWMIAIVSLWATWFNVYPKNSLEVITEIGLISKEDDAAKKLLANIRELIMIGDRHMSKIYAKNEKIKNRDTYFSGQYIEPNNTAQLTFANRCKILSLPPTKRVRQYGFSWVFGDEFAFIEPKDTDVATFFSAVVRPTIADTAGKMTLSSTPNGKTNLFTELFDPFEEKGTSFTRAWFPWTVFTDDTPEGARYKKFVTEERETLRKQGREKFFAQEYEADFVTTVDSFLDNDDVDAYFDRRHVSHYEWDKSPCVIGFDGGVSKCQSVLTVKTEYKGQIIRLWSHAFEAGYDLNRLFDASNDNGWSRLLQRYDVSTIVPDDCVQLAWMIDRLKTEGYPVTPYSFANVQRKNEAMYAYRGLLKQHGKMVSYPDEALRTEMYGMQEELLQRYYSIHKGSGNTDDRFDSDVFATIPFFDDDSGGFTSMPLDLQQRPDQQQEIITDSSADRVDHEWQRLIGRR